MGCFNECCGNEALDLSVCQLVLLDDYIDEATIGFDITSAHDGCFVGMDDTLVDADYFCLGCDLGCHAADDSGTNTHSLAWDREGRGYLRPRSGAVRNRDAENKVRDFPVFQQWQSDAMERHALFVDKVELERAACYRNDQDFACWGPDTGHPCHCFHKPGPDCADHGFPDGSGTALPGFLWDRFFYEMTSWPMRKKADTQPGKGAIHCRRWTDAARTVPGEPNGNPAVLIDIRDHLGQTRFLNFHRSYHNFAPRAFADAIIGCAARVEGGSDCSLGLPRPDVCQTAYECDCSVRQGGEGWRGDYCRVVGPSNCFRFEYLHIANWSPGVRVHGPLDELKNQILANLGAINLPGQGPLDSLQHRVGSDGNAGLNHYTREWTAADLDAAPVVATLEGWTKWGTFPVTADVVLRRVKLTGHVIAHQTVDYTFQPLDQRRWISPYTVLRIEVDLGLRATFTDGRDEHQIGDQPVTIDYQPGAFFPTIGPPGNELVLPADVPASFIWQGRLNQHSDPPVPVIRTNPLGQSNANHCGNLAERCGLFEVPALPGDYRSADPLTTYTGSVTLSFADPG